MLLINFDQKINYNILVAFFSLSPFFGYSGIFIALRHTHSRFTHFICCHRPYKNHINFVRLFYRFRWFSHSGLKIVIFKWVCQPTCKINEWYIIRAILFFINFVEIYFNWFSQNSMPKLMNWEHSNGNRRLMTVNQL